MASLVKSAGFIAIFAVILYLTREFFQGGVCTSTDRIDGKVVVVTGANTGIGKETVVDLVNRGARVYMACRSQSRCASAAADVKNRTAVDDRRVITMTLDLASYKSIRQFVEEYKKREKRLDILINNAGVMFIPERTLTEDGNEMTFGTNHLGHFLLTNLLLELILKSAPSRVVTVSSLGHQFATELPMDNLDLDGEYNRIYAYAYSKLANIMFSRELSKRLEGTGVTTYSLHPGSIITELGRHVPLANNSIVSGVMHTFGSIFFKTITQGAQTQICCAVDKEMGKQSGLYYSDCAVATPIPYAEDDEKCKELWDRSVELTKLQRDEMVKQVL